MDLHPIIVHIPIAFLAIYAGLEILTCVPKLKNSSTFFSIKAFLLTVGFGATLVALASGENAEHLNREFINKALVETHSTYAALTSWVFGLLFVIYTTMIVSIHAEAKMYVSKISSGLANLMQKVGDFFKTYYTLAILLAVVGLALVSITGALGGALVYGTDAKDPFIVFTVDHICGADCK